MKYFVLRLEREMGEIHGQNLNTQKAHCFPHGHVPHVNAYVMPHQPVHKRVVIGSHLFVIQLLDTLIVKVVPHLTIELIATLFVSV